MYGDCKIILRTEWVVSPKVKWILLENFKSLLRRKEAQTWMRVFNTCPVEEISESSQQQARVEVRHRLLELVAKADEYIISGQTTVGEAVDCINGLSTKDAF